MQAERAHCCRASSDALQTTVQQVHGVRRKHQVLLRCQKLENGDEEAMRDTPIGLYLEMLAQRREAVNADAQRRKAVNADRDRMSTGVQKLYLGVLVRGYGLQSFRDDVKELMIKTCVEGERVAFLFTDTSTSRG